MSRWENHPRVPRPCGCLDISCDRCLSFAFQESRPTFVERASLRERVDDLRGARQRIIEAADAERRRIERDLHDGAQQRLVAVALTLGLAESRLGDRSRERRGQLIAQAREEAQLAIEELRELARGIHPALLSDRGLARRSRRSPRALRCRWTSRRAGGPLGAPVEAAAYFVTAEALTNVAKYAHASERSFCLRRARVAYVEIRDDGVGGADLSGTGLCGLRDRADSSTGASCSTRSARRSAFEVAFAARRRGGTAMV